MLRFAFTAFWGWNWVGWVEYGSGKVFPLIMTYPSVSLLLLSLLLSSWKRPFFHSACFDPTSLFSPLIYFIFVFKFLFTEKSTNRCRTTDYLTYSLQGVSHIDFFFFFRLAPVHAYFWRWQGQMHRDFSSSLPLSLSCSLWNVLGGYM